MENTELRNQQDQKIAIIMGLIDENEMEALTAILKKMQAVEVAEILKELTEEQLLEVLPVFEDEDLGYIASNMDIELLVELFDKVDRRFYASMVTNMSSDVRADLYQHLEKERQLELLPYLDKKTREDVIHLSSYPPETAGSIMVTDFATVKEGMTVAQALEKIRKDAPTKKMIYYVYVVDEHMKMKGFVTLKDLIMAEPGTLVKDVLHEDFIYADVYEDRESAAVKIEKYDMVAIPVLNPLKQLAGIVRHDDALDVIRAEHTEDLEKFMGIVHDPAAEELNYMETSPIQHFKKRVIWLATLSILGLLTGMVIHRFEEAIASLVVLALYMPMVADTGGNTGSQAATVVIRAMALGQVKLKQWGKIIFKEARISILLAIVIGTITFGKVLFLSWDVALPGDLTLSFIGVGIAFALSLQVISATLIGASLPLIVRSFGGDPAVAASPAITTLVDITGLLIYFGVASLLFF